MRTDQVKLDPDGPVFVTFGEVPIPGRNPGRSLTGAVLRLQFDNLGISPIGSRQASFFQLAGEVPAPIRADLIGVANKTAAAWAELVARYWNGYIAQRR